MGKRIIRSITGDQLATLLDLVCRPTVLLSVLKDMKRIDADLAKTIEKIMTREEDSPRHTSLPEIASERKTLETWRALWKKWDAIVSEVGDENGRYAEQEEEWDTPSFDGYALANDLEAVAGQMAVLMDEIFRLVDEPDLFKDALLEIGSNIDSYPEWMGVDDFEGCELGEKTTRCILKWIWLACEEADNRGEAFLKEVHEVESAHDMVSLNGTTLWEYFTALPDAACRGIYKAFTQNVSTYKLENIRSFWHRLFHHYERKYDTESYLDTCRRHLAENWRYGSPLIENALESNDYKSAENYLERTFAALLGEGEKPWLPESHLLIEVPRFRYEPKEDNVMKLLEIWAKLADDLNLPARKAALLFQTGTFLSREDWEAVIDLYNSLSDHETRDVLEPLFDSWKKEMVSRSSNYTFNTYDPKNNWVCWLIEAQADAPGKKKGFIEKMKTWLNGLNTNLKMFEKNAKWLALFTRDVPGSDKLAKKYPSFSGLQLPGEETTLPF